MVKNIYLYRHGETNWNILDRVMGQKEDIITYFTPNGYEQIRKISNDLKKKQVDVIFCSDYQRTTDTANLANIELNLPLFISKEVRGLNVGKYQGMYFDDYIKQVEVQKAFDDYNFSIYDGESINHLNTRIECFIRKICEETIFQNIAIISHSAAISNFKAYLTNEPYISLSACFISYNNGILEVKNSIPNKHSYINLPNDLILVRHAVNIVDESISNDYLPLSKEGIKQAHTIEKVLQNSFDVIISSPSKRALETAYIISSGKKKVIQDARLFERGYGNLKRDGKETDFEAKERFLKLLFEIITNYKDKRVLMVSHGSLMKLAQDVIECHCENRDNIENCTIIRYNKDKIKEIMKKF